MNKELKKITAVGAAASMMMAMSVTAFAADGDVYARFCQDGAGFDSISMTQLAVDGPAMITDDGTTVTVQLNLDGFAAAKHGITGTGYLNTLTVDGTTYTATYGADTDGDGYNNGSITFEISSDNYVVDDAEVFSDVNVSANLTIMSGVFTVPMTSDADLYFSTSEPVYTATAE